MEGWLGMIGCRLGKVLPSPRSYFEWPERERPIHPGRKGLRGVEDGLEDGLGGGVGVQGTGFDLVDEIGEAWVGGDEVLGFLVDVAADGFEELTLATFAAASGQEPGLL